MKPEKMADQEKAQPETGKDEDKQPEPQPAAGTLLMCGATDFWAPGRTKGGPREGFPSLPVPHRLKSLEGIKISFIATGSASMHAAAGSPDGRVWVWGRNEKGQLGLGDTLNRTGPTLLDSLKDVKPVGGAAGRHHTVLVCSDGSSYAMGLNSLGQCGTVSVKKVHKGGEDMLLHPQLCLVSHASFVACGAEFTMWLCEGKVWAAGSPQYGQLGDGSDHQYNTSDSSIKMVFEPQPTPALIASLADKKVTRVACGHNHTIALCSDGGVWTWGFGGFGRLGHRVQQDELKPRLVETLTGRIQVPPDAIVAAGGASSFVTMMGGQLMAWGKLKASGDSTMYPTPYLELAGWDIKSMSCGSTTFGCSATSGSETSVITWGQSAGFSELGYGEKGKKSSASPDKCMALEGVACHQVGMNAGFSLFLCDSEHEKVKKAPVFEPEVETDAGGGAASGKGGAGGGKRKAPAGGGKAKKKGK